MTNETFTPFSPFQLGKTKLVLLQRFIQSINLHVTPVRRKTDTCSLHSRIVIRNYQYQTPCGPPIAQENFAREETLVS